MTGWCSLQLLALKGSTLGKGIMFFKVWGKWETIQTFHIFKYWQLINKSNPKCSVFHIYIRKAICLASIQVFQTFPAIGLSLGTAHSWILEINFFINESWYFKITFSFCLIDSLQIELTYMNCSFEQRYEILNHLGMS